jgi:hypothetical protein
VVFVETPAAIEQGGGNVLAQNPNTYLDCTVTLSTLVEDGFTITLNGTVTGFLNPPAANTRARPTRRRPTRRRLHAAAVSARDKQPANSVSASSALDCPRAISCRTSALRGVSVRSAEWAGRAAVGTQGLRGDIGGRTLGRPLDRV